MKVPVKPSEHLTIDAIWLLADRQAVSRHCSTRTYEVVVDPAAGIDSELATVVLSILCIQRMPCRFEISELLESTVPEFLLDVTPQEIQLLWKHIQSAVNWAV